MAIIESSASAQDWDRAWAATSSASAYASREWADVWAAAFPGRFRPSPIRLTWPDGASVILPVTMEHRLAGIVRIARLGPAGTYASVLVEPTVSTSGDRSGAVIEWLSRRYRDSVLTLNPFEPMPTSLPSDCVAGSTLAVRLGDPVDVLRGSWSSGRKNDLARARKAALHVETARDPSDWAAYVQCYVDSVRRWGGETRLVYPDALFDALARAPERLLRLWVARRDGAVVGGAIVVYDRSCAYYWHAASRQEGLQVGSATMVLLEVIRDATTRGLRYLDLGSSATMSGVADFKAGFRPVEFDTRTLIRQGFISGSLRRIARRT